jgi:hypothetical protein
MKIRVEFPPCDGDKPKDMESSFDSVELTTLHAGSYEAWGDAVRDFAGTAGTRWDKNRILQHALALEGGCLIDDWAYFVALLGDDVKQELRAALSGQCAGGKRET